MLFNSIDFVFFLPIVIILFFAIPHKYRWILLLCAGYYFYMCWKVKYAILLVTTTVIDYSSALLMAQTKKRKVRLTYLLISLITNLGLLFYFKYYNFFTGSMNFAINKFNILYQIPALELLLPVGISFYTFQSLSYTIDVYTGVQKAEKHLGYFAAYVSFFPQLVAGPIERYSHLAPQLQTKQVFTYDNLANGLRLILYGLFIKMVIADNISGYVDIIYKSPAGYSSLSILTGLVLYSFQIYCDFYGYSTIAVGSAKIMGINLMDNFKTPYLSKSITEFWQRWHISLSTWLRDYVFMNLAINRKNYSVSFLYFSTIIVFLVSGIWHGANWTFIVWGLSFGIFIVAEREFNRRLRIKPVQQAFSFWHILLALKTFILVTFIWVLFRSKSLSDALNMFKQVIHNYKIQDNFHVDTKIWVFLILFIISDLLLYNTRFDKWCHTKHFLIRWTVYSLLIFVIIVFSGVENFPFIYFQF